LKKKFRNWFDSDLPNLIKGMEIMIRKILCIAFLLIASAVWAGDKINPDDVKFDSKEEIEAQLKEKVAQLKAYQDEIKIRHEKWQKGLASGPVGRFQAVAIGQSGAIILDTKEGRVWAVRAAEGTGPKIVYIGQATP
jgi:hypothetical protein